MQKTNLKTIDIIGAERLNLYFAYLEKCRGVEQSAMHHPEGDVFNHSLQCLYWALKESNDIDSVFAAMLHDIGKIFKSKGHEKIATKWLQGICSTKTLWLIEQHMRIWYLLLGNMKHQGKVKELVNHCWLPELIQLARWDKLARSQTKTINYNKNSIIELMGKCCDRHFEK